MAIKNYIFRALFANHKMFLIINSSNFFTCTEPDIINYSNWPYIIFKESRRIIFPPDWLVWIIQRYNILIVNILENNSKVKWKINNRNTEIFIYKYYFSIPGKLSVIRCYTLFFSIAILSLYWSLRIIQAIIRSFPSTSSTELIDARSAAASGIIKW